MTNIEVAHEELEFSSGQLARLDEIDNAVHELLKVMTEDYDLEWDMEIIGSVADAVADILVLTGKRVRFPTIVGKQDGSQHIEEYHEVG